MGGAVLIINFQKALPWYTYCRLYHFTTTLIPSQVCPKRGYNLKRVNSRADRFCLNGTRRAACGSGGTGGRSTSSTHGRTERRLFSSSQGSESERFTLGGTCKRLDRTLVTAGVVLLLSSLLLSLLLSLSLLISLKCCWVGAGAVVLVLVFSLVSAVVVLCCSCSCCW